MTDLDTNEDMLDVLVTGSSRIVQPRTWQIEEDADRATEIDVEEKMAPSSASPRTLIVTDALGRGLGGKYAEEEEGRRYRNGDTVLWYAAPYWLFTSADVALRSGFPDWSDIMHYIYTSSSSIVDIKDEEIKFEWLDDDADGDKKDAQKETDFLIVGGGPAGIMAAYHIAVEHPTKKVVILEQNTHTHEEYAESYEDILLWQQAMNDPRFQYLFSSLDGKSVWLGQGLGGGTLHFGLQYIDSEDIVDRTYPEWRKIDGRRNVMDEINNITMASRYTYDEESPNEAYQALRRGLEKSGLIVYNNKVYSSDLTSGKRLLLGDLLKGFKNVEVKYGVNVDKMNIVNGRCVSVFDGTTTHAANDFILSAGAIQTPAVLQRSGIDCGNSMFDHAGFTLTYGKMEQKVVEVTAEAAETAEITLNKETLAIINRVTKRLVYRVGGSVPDEDKNKIFDFTDWARMHPGGAASIEKWTQRDNILLYPAWHGPWRWVGNRSRFVEIGVANQTILFSELPLNIRQAEGLKEALLSDVQYVPASLGFGSIIPHLQTRDADLRWQTYYSTLPGMDNLLIVTHAQSTALSGAGSVKVSDSTDSANPDVTLNHFVDTEEGITDLMQAYEANHKALTEQGYVLLSPSVEITPEYIAQNAGSIYHYHGSCVDAIDSEQRVKGLSNVLVGDASALSKPWAGSTSVPAMVMGYLAGKIACA